MKLRELLRKVNPDLRRDAEIILAHLLKVKVVDLHLLRENDVDPNVSVRLEELLKKRKQGVPTPYLIGEWDFFGRTFRVREGILVPRPETEVLVEEVLKLIPEDANWTGLDLGTGTGCIAITLLLERWNLRMVAVDLNPEAVEVTLENARTYGVLDRIEVLEGDLFGPVEGRVFDFIVSNPPYVPENLWNTLPPEVRAEGKVSVVGGEKGYETIKRIGERVKEFLKPGGFLALEIGHDQGCVVRSILEETGLKVNIYRDLSGQDRVVVAWN